jgi:hypothetical protein
MTYTRLLCTETVAAGVLPTAGGLLSATQGAVYDIPGDAASVPVQALLSAHDVGARAPAPYFVLLGPSGPTSARPTFPNKGDSYVDTTLGVALTFDGSSWRDCTGTSH